MNRMSYYRQEGGTELQEVVEFAKCRHDNENMFPHEQAGLSINEVERKLADRVCLGRWDNEPCPILQQCLEYALLNREDDGVWGGLSSDDRMKLRKRRQRNAAAARAATSTG